MKHFYNACRYFAALSMLVILTACTMFDGGMSGTEGSYPHSRNDRILPLPAGTYEIADRYGQGGVEDISISRDNEYIFRMDNFDVKVGFYPNAADTFVMYVKGGPAIRYYIVEVDAGTKVVTAFNTAWAMTIWQKQSFPGTQFKNNDVPQNLTLPFTVPAYNKAFLKQLAEDATLRSQFRKAFEIFQVLKQAEN
jgi:hypothetical protein